MQDVRPEVLSLTELHKRLMRCEAKLKHAHELIAELSASVRDLQTSGNVDPDETPDVIDEMFGQPKRRKRNTV